MRKIFIDSNVQAIAEEYRDEVLKHLHQAAQSGFDNLCSWKSILLTYEYKPQVHFRPRDPMNRNPV